MQNTATLIGYYGGDKTHCLSAWQSTNLDLEFTKDINSRTQVLFAHTAKNKKKSPADLLKMLASEGHHSVFEKSTLHFQVTADIATHIHCIKHRIGVSVNSESARYKELTDKWHIPDDWHDIFAEKSICTDGEYTWAEELENYLSYGHELYHVAVEQLESRLGRKRAKESARYFLSYAKQLDFDIMFNFRSFVHFQQLRNNEHAQKEVKDIAQLMLDQVIDIPGNPFNDSLIAFNLIGQNI